MRTTSSSRSSPHARSRLPRWQGDKAEARTVPRLDSAARQAMVSSLHVRALHALSSPRAAQLLLCSRRYRTGLTPARMKACTSRGVHARGPDAPESAAPSPSTCIASAFPPARSRAVPSRSPPSPPSPLSSASSSSSSSSTRAFQSHSSLAELNSLSAARRSCASETRRACEAARAANEVEGGGGAGGWVEVEVLERAEEDEEERRADAKGSGRELTRAACEASTSGVCRE